MKQIVLLGFVFAFFAQNAIGCSHQDNDNDLDTGSDTDTDTDTDATIGEITGTIRTNHFGWRPSDTKIAVVLGHGGAPIELRSGDDAQVVASYTLSSLSSDEDSGDAVATVDLSDQTTAGRYFLYLPESEERSYTFKISEGIYDAVGAVAMKSFYYQRCNHSRTLPYASDALGSFDGLGSRWVDGACHTEDQDCPAGPDSPDHGNLDLHGGWHDAGDFQKTLWGRGLPQMLFAYELNPDAWSDGQLNIPESGNSLPDILDELKWELDFYVRMQRPDGHFMTSVKGNYGTICSPPSASDEGRFYFDTTSPSGNGWSGGGVTIERATGNAVLSLAHAAIVFEQAGQPAIADTYQAAATTGWAWLSGIIPPAGIAARLKAAAAAAVYRMDPNIASARDHAEAFPWDTWDGLLPYSVTPGERVIATGAFHYLMNESGDIGLQTIIETAVSQAIIDRAFEEAGVYGGMFGAPGNAWDWGWGSNANQAMYGAHLLMAARLGITGEHAAADIHALAARYLHYMLGLNPLGMVYLTNMAAYGGEHSSFQIYHCWFSYTGGDGDNGNADYNGLPEAVSEPLYPYHPDDTQTSTYGPAPGLVPGGPNADYSANYEIPNMAYPAYAYRDWSVGCDLNGSECLSASWEITEPMAAYQGPFILLVSFFMNAAP
ncbi:MAG: glycoside hydrolase family 9 protein [Myxococcota bacterium]|nr:glycoside hydrolase family 9 protein [Myxococcota bacterium]